MSTGPASRPICTVQISTTSARIKIYKTNTRSTSRHRDLTRTETSSAPIGDSSLSQTQTPSNQEQQLALPRIRLTGAQNHGAASFLLLRVASRDVRGEDDDWCHGHEPLTDAQRSGGSSLFLVPWSSGRSCPSVLTPSAVAGWEKRDCMLGPGGDALSY
jgi:hypothetical protein